MTAPVAVTGIGVAAPTGLGIEQYWAATLRGQNGIRRITRFPPESYRSRLAGEIPGFDPAEHLPSRLLPQTDHMTRLALVAAAAAFADAGLDPATLPDYAGGVITSSSSGGFEFGQRELEKLWSKGSEHVSAYQSFAWFYAVNTGQISIRHRLRGPSGVLVTEQAGGLDAVAQARRQIRKGAQLIVSGGMDSALCPWGWAAQTSTRRLSGRDDPDQAYLPFDVDAQGYVPGEGGAILILEDPAAAGRENARVYGLVAGYGATFDPPPGSGRPPGLRRALELALDDAGLKADQVDVVFTDAAGLADLDRAEAEALAGLFGAYGVPATAPKTMTGRLSSGGAALDLATALLSIRDGVIPPTINVTAVRPEYQLDLVRSPRVGHVRVAAVLARGHGGFNSALVVTAPDSLPRREPVERPEETTP